MNNSDFNNQDNIKKFTSILIEKGFNVQSGKVSSDFVEVVILDNSDLLPVCNCLKSDENCLFDFLVSVSAVDLIDTAEFECVYHLFSTVLNHKLVLKIKLDRNSPVLPSVYSIWPTADWHERECFDLMGIEFSDHPNLKRLLLPYGWIGYPLRKDYIMNDERLIWNQR